MAFRTSLFGTRSTCSCGTAAVAKHRFGALLHPIRRRSAVPAYAYGIERIAADEPTALVIVVGTGVVGIADRLTRACETVLLAAPTPLADTIVHIKQADRGALASLRNAFARVRESEGQYQEESRTDDCRSVESRWFHFPPPRQGLSSCSRHMSNMYREVVAGVWMERGLG